MRSAAQSETARQQRWKRAGRGSFGRRRQLAQNETKRNKPEYTAQYLTTVGCLKVFDSAFSFQIASYNIRDKTRKGGVRDR